MHVGLHCHLCVNGGLVALCWNWTKFMYVLIKLSKNQLFLMMFGNNTFIVEEKLCACRFMIWIHYVEQQFNCGLVTIHELSMDVDQIKVVAIVAPWDNAPYTWWVCLFVLVYIKTTNSIQSNMFARCMKTWCLKHWIFIKIIVFYNSTRSILCPNINCMWENLGLLNIWPCNSFIYS
jgi:hypothetical protein